MYGYKEGLKSYSIILAPKEHPSTDREVDSLCDKLRNEYKIRIKIVDLEDFVEKIIEGCPEEYRGDFEKFKDRYLNWNKVE